MSYSQGPRPDEVLQDYLDELLYTSEEPSLNRYADPLEEQRERLQKLLSSASPLAQTVKADPESAAVVVEPMDPTPEPAEALRFSETLSESVSEPDEQEPPAADKPDLKVELAPTEAKAAPATQLEQVEQEIKELEPQPRDFEIRDVEWLDNGRPTWAQQRFDVLLFKVSGLTLAVPLISLGQIQPLNDELTPLFGQADWFMGLLPTPAGKIRTVNTAKFVMPERYDENFVLTAQYVVSINGVPWGLAVDSVEQPITLSPEDVKWRSERSRRPWLAGTVKEHMCALLDIPRVGQLLMEADRAPRRSAR